VPHPLPILVRRKGYEIIVREGIAERFAGIMVKTLAVDEGNGVFQGMVSQHLFLTAWGVIQRFHKNLGNYNNIPQ
jgi:hypothetical protein